MPAAAPDPERYRSKGDHMDEHEKLEAARNVLWFFGDYGLG